MSKCYNSSCPFKTANKECPCTSLCAGYVSEPTRIIYSTSTMPVKAEYEEENE